MSNNNENDRSISTAKIYPIDLAPPKITIVKSMPVSDVKMAHLIPGQQKTNSGQVITHPGSVGLMRSTTQIIPAGVGSQSQMIVSGAPVIQGAQIVSQGTQLTGQNAQLLNQSQLLTASGPISLSSATQIISQGTQLTTQASNSNSSTVVQTCVASSGTGTTQVLNVGGQIVSGAANLVVSSSVRTLPPSVRVLPPLPHHNTRPVLTNVSVSSANSVLVNKGVTSHVPRGLAAGASLAVRPITPTTSAQTLSSQAGNTWTGNRNSRALVYGPRATASPRAPSPRALTPPVSNSQTPNLHSAIVTLPTTAILTSSSVISGAVRLTPPRAPTPTSPAPRPLPLLQRNYQPAPKVVNARGVGNSAPPQVYYEVPRLTHPHSIAYTQVTQSTTINTIPTQVVSDVRTQQTALSTTPSALARPTILRKRDVDGSPTKPVTYNAPGWEDVPAGGGTGSGSTTISAASSPRPEDIPPDDLSPRKKPRKQIMSNEVRQCDYPTEETPPSPPPPVPFNPPPKRPQLTSSYVCGWRSTALHFVRPSDVRRREPKARDIIAIASQKHVLASAEGWKVHHITAQMDDLVSLEADVGEQLERVLRSLENTSGRALNALQPHSHTLLELLKGNIQRSKIVCEGVQEARADILRVFNHRNFVSDILTRQADKRCFRKHRSQS